MKDMSTPAPLLEVQDLSVSFRSEGRIIEAVKHVSFSIARGETLALVGESGSGKSVSAMSILQLLPYPVAFHPSGSIRLDGRELMGAGEKAMREIRGAKAALVPQEPLTALNPLHTIDRQIIESILLHTPGISRQAAQERTVELLTLVGIKDAKARLKAYPHQLSGGQRQRVMIAMALANEPDLLIADEPTTALDVTIQAQVLELLDSLKKRLNMAMLLITHDLAIVRKVADRVCVMTGGEIVERGNAEEIFLHPHHPYTKALLAAEPKGEPVASRLDAKPVMEADDLKVWFPIKAGFLGKTVDYVKAVDGLTISVPEGQTLGIVGESGSGKSTLGLALLRLISSDGPIRFEGKRIDGLKAKDLRPLRARMQIVFQDPFASLSPRMSVAQIVGEGLSVHAPHMSYAERRARVTEVLKEVGLEGDVLDRYPHEFSGGQRQRIAIARALVLKPDFVVLDEPTSALDMSVQAQIVDLLRALQKAHNLTFMFISHDLKVVRALSHQVVVMKDGKVMEHGPAQQIFDHPATAYTKALMAAAFELEARHTEAVNE
jgi:microcin C transport system ATP-binding protein